MKKIRETYNINLRFKKNTKINNNATKIEIDIK